MQLETESMEAIQESIAQPPTAQGRLFVLSAPSGTGKDTVIQELKAQGLDFYVVASVTTRAMRPGESEGNPYYFVSKERFDEMIAQGELLEHALVHGNWYGQPLQPIRDNLHVGRDVLLKIDVQGAETVRKKLPGAIYIFLVPGSIEELVMRLTNRHTETEEQIQRRLINARNELAQQKYYDYTVMNRQDHLQDAVENLRAIIRAEHCRTHPRTVTL